MGGPATGVTWEGGPNPDDVMLPITLGPLPDQPGRLQFKVVQTYDNGTVDRWIDDWPEGAEEPLNPGPVLGLVPGAAGTIPATTAPPTTAAPTTTTTAATAAPEDEAAAEDSDDDSGTNPAVWLIPVAIVVAAAAGPTSTCAGAGRPRASRAPARRSRPPPRRAGRGLASPARAAGRGRRHPAAEVHGPPHPPVARQDTDGDQHMAGDQHGQHVGGEAVDVVQPHEGRAPCTVVSPMPVPISVPSVATKAMLAMRCPGSKWPRWREAPGEGPAGSGPASCGRRRGRSGASPARR